MPQQSVPQIYLCVKFGLLQQKQLLTECKITHTVFNSSNHNLNVMQELEKDVVNSAIKHHASTFFWTSLTCGTLSIHLSVCYHHVLVIFAMANQKDQCAWSISFSGNPAAGFVVILQEAFKNGTK